MRQDDRLAAPLASLAAPLASLAAPLASLAALIVLAVPLTLAQSETGVVSDQEFQAEPYVTTELTHFMTVTLRGGYVAAGTGLTGVSEATIVIDSIPQGAQLVGGVLYWAFLDRTGGPSHRRIRVNNVLVEGELLGRVAFLLGRESFVYRGVLSREQLLNHDLHPLGELPPLPSGNGAYLLSGFPLEEPTRPQGATLVLVYEHEQMRPQDVVFTDGNVLPHGGFLPPWWRDTRADITGFAAEAPVEATSTYIVGAGSSSSLARDKAGFQAASHALRFLPGDQVFDSSDGPRWDTETLELTGLIAPGDRSGTAVVRLISTRWGGLWWVDDLIWAAHVMSVSTGNPVEPDPGALFRGW